MPERVKDRAFDPFFTTKEVGKGTGLGLSQIHGFAAQAGGSAQIDSQEGLGTTVTVLIPQSEKEVDQANAHDQAVPLLASIKILLVEDNDQVRAFALNMLLDAGCSVFEASNAKQALAKLAASAVDVMLTDVVMPEMSGIELANQVRSTNPDLPIVLVSGYSDDLVGTGTDYPFLTKPFNSLQLRAVLGAAIAGSKH